ncbi:hypothetical protein QBC43DRAFT_331978 [Cladorrhinum sp. PSN259]|nr:hypothetical protein QBC43DRAFT_331978 [Cladorrhinum sp. PSN259]
MLRNVNNQQLGSAGGMGAGDTCWYHNSLSDTLLGQVWILGALYLVIINHSAALTRWDESRRHRATQKALRNIPIAQHHGNHVHVSGTTPSNTPSTTLLNLHRLACGGPRSPTAHLGHIFYKACFDESVPEYSRQCPLCRVTLVKNPPKALTRILVHHF